VWLALSELYLDTELSSDQLEHLAKTLAASPYSRAELEAILLTELHPVLAANLLAVAGVWSGFDAAWLQGRILARSRRRLCWPSWLLPLRRSMLAQAAPLLTRVETLRHVDC
jgi:hypothetical protein